MTSCIRHKRAIVRVSLDGLHAFPVGPFEAFVWHGSTSFVFR